MIVPAYLPYYVLTGAIGAIAALLFGLRSALRNAHWTADDRTATLRAATVTIIGWFLLTLVLASADAYRGTANRIPTIQYGILVPILIGGLLIWRSPRVARIIDVVPQHWLIGVQLYRAIGVIFLILYATGKLPGLFAWPAGLGDVLVGVLATSPSAFQLFAFDLPNELVSRFPLVLIPVFLVPISVLLHLASLTKLRRNALRDNNRREIARATV